MLISKFDLYRSEWLELVFDDRNKEYGAYDLRKHYAGNLFKAMGIAFFSVMVLFGAYFVFHKSHLVPRPITTDAVRPIITVNLRPRVEPPKTVRHEMPTPPAHAPTIKYTTPVPVPDPVSVNPPTRTELIKATIGTDNVKGTGQGENVLKIDKGTGGIDPGPTVNTNEPVTTDLLEVMPEPYGGAAAWAKFLQKNIHYPAQASEEGKQGKVYLSFII